MHKMKNKTTPFALPQTTADSCRWYGVVEALHNGLLYGWVIDAEHPETRVTLEICLNDEVIGCLNADVSRTDLALQFKNITPELTVNDYCHGFVADLGGNFKSKAADIVVRIANTEITLPGTLAYDNTTQLPLAATSIVFSDGGLNLHGWAIDLSNESRRLTIRAYLGDKQLAETVADILNPALRSFESSAHGFNLNLPLELADGNSHQVRIVDEKGNPLNGSPITVCCFAEGCEALLALNNDDLLKNVIKTYERYLPRSLGMEYYTQWSSVFESNSFSDNIAGTNTNSLTTEYKIGLIVVGNGDSHALERTTNSLVQQLDVTVQLFVACNKKNNKPNFGEFLQLALNAHCDIIGCIRVGDTLPPHALSCSLAGFVSPDAQIVYTDSEYKGEPWFKPAWNLEYALSSDYPLELMLIRSSLLKTHIEKNKTWPNSQAELSWFMLAMAESQKTKTVVHIPRVLYQFQSALNDNEQQTRFFAAGQALQSFESTSLLTLETNLSISSYFQARRIKRPISMADQNKTISLIIPTRDQVDMLERCINSIQRYTEWPNLEIIVIDNNSIEKKSKAYFRSLQKKNIKILPIPGAFNFADLNNRAVQEAKGDIIGLINNDIEALHAGWLEEIVSHLLSPGVGAVGGKLLWPNGMVQHGGVILGTGNVAGHYGNNLADEDWGNHGRNQLVQQVSAVTAACLFLRKSDYIVVGGMDAKAFPVAFNDVDLCLKLRKQGKAIIWTPYAKLLHAESASRGHEDTPQKRTRAQREINQLQQRWGSVLLRDPAYHPSLNLDAHSQAFGGMAIPPRDRSPRLSCLIDQE